MLNMLVAAAMILTAVLLIGCGDKTDVDRDRGSGNQTIGSGDTTGVASEMSGGSTTGENSEVVAQTVAVTLKDGEIAMPTIIKPGPTTFNVTNNGQQEHGFEIEGGGQQTGLNADLDAGQSATFEADLQPGTYKVHCDDHGDDAMALEISVQP